MNISDLRFAGICRKSPSKKKNYQDNVDLQKKNIVERICKDFQCKPEEIKIEWFIDNHTSGDTPNRPELNRLFSLKETKNFAYCDKVDRFSRSWLGIKWFMDNFTTNQDISIPHKGCKLRFVQYLPDFYNEDDTINIITFLFFWDLCKNAMFELVNQRQKLKLRLLDLRKNPDEWKKRYYGRSNWKERTKRNEK